MYILTIYISGNMASAYCLGENGNEYDQALVTFFKQAFEKAGGTVVTDSFPKDNSDFSSLPEQGEGSGLRRYLRARVDRVLHAARLSGGFPERRHPVPWLRHMG